MMPRDHRGGRVSSAIVIKPIREWPIVEFLRSLALGTLVKS